MTTVGTSGGSSSAHHFTPLRYPGGKAKLAEFVKRIIEKNNLLDGHYAEPYAGGAAIAMELLLQEYVSHIHINDVSRPVYSFWRSVLEHTEELLRLVRDTKVSVRSWDKQRKIFANQGAHDYISVGFATFFLNRTNRSGILNGGIIGGRDQSGPWKIDARYNSKELMRRIEVIAKLKRRITLTRFDAEAFLKRSVNKLPDQTLIYLDPPYFAKGKELYYDFYEYDDHERLSEFMKKNIKRHKFIISYDNCKEVRQFYKGMSGFTYKIGYNAREVRLGTEVMFFSKGLIIPAIEPPMSSCRLLRKAA